jgi:hypothetical protein
MNVLLNGATITYDCVCSLKNEKINFVVQLHQQQPLVSMCQNFPPPKPKLIWQHSNTLIHETSHSMLTKLGEFDYNYEMSFYLHLICKWRSEFARVKNMSQS